MRQCPNCSYARQPNAITCPGCGLVYAKYNPARAAELDAIRARRPTPAPAAPAAPAAPSAAVIAGNVAVCTKCEEIGHVQPGRKMNTLIFILLLLCYIVPGLIYYISGKMDSKPVCGACGSENLVSAKTRVGRRIIAAQFPAATIGRAELSTRIAEPVFGQSLGALMAFFTVVFVALAFTAGDGAFTCVFLAGICGVFAWRGFTAKTRIVPINENDGLINWEE